MCILNLRTSVGKEIVSPASKCLVNYVTLSHTVKSLGALVRGLLKVGLGR